MDWTSVFLPSLAGAASTIFFIWLINRRGKEEAPRTRLETGKGVFWFLVLFSPMLLALAFWGGYDIFVGGDGDAPNPLLGIGLGLFIAFLGLGGMWQAHDSRTRWAKWDEYTLTIHQKKGPEKAYALGDISALKYKALLQLWQIHFVDGEKFIFSEMMTGSKELIALCNKQLYDEEAG